MTIAFEFLKENRVFFIATADGGVPRIRPFGFTMKRNGKLYLCTGKSKEIYQQLSENPEAEISACGQDRTWVRVRGKIVFDDSREAKAQVFDEAPHLSHMYPKKADDENFVTMYFTDATAMYFSFSEPPREIPVV